ncbi:MAG: hypothetical protein PWR32_390 [Candidatus Woesearchaeota archaeon]|nr:hypothetical protein [Candidatus Woesearchaeota archaeon]
MNKTFKQAIFVYALAILAGVLAYSLRILFARNLSLFEYGLFYAVYSFIFFFAPFRDLGLSEATLFFINKYLAKKDKSRIKGVMIVGFVPQFVLGLVITLILFLLRNFLVEHYFKTPLALSVYNILLVLFAFHTILPTLMYLFSAYQKVVYFKIAEVMNLSSILFLSIILFSTTDLGVRVPAYSYLFGALITILVYYIFFVLNFKDIIKTKAKINKDLVREMFSYALPIMFSTAAGIILTYSDIILLTFFKGAEATGLYNIALPSLTIMLVFITPLQIILFPKFSRWYHEKKDKTIISALNLIYNNFLFLSLPLGLIFFAYPELVIKVLFGAKYLDAANTLRIFAAFFVFRAIREINFAIVAGIGKAKERSKVVYYAALFNVILDIILIPMFSVMGAAIATSLSWVLMAYLTHKIITKDYKAKIDFKLQLKVVLSNVLFLLSIFVLKKLFTLTNAIIEAVLVLTIASFVYIISLFMFKALTTDKILHFKKIIFSG